MTPPPFTNTDTTITGTPTALLRWAWNRNPRRAPAITIDGNRTSRIPRCVIISTQ